jgi:acyl-CoA thioesterase I
MNNFKPTRRFCLTFSGLMVANFLAPPVLAQPVSTKPVRIAAFGDSLSAGYNLPARAGFPAVLERVLRTNGLNVVVENAAVSGDTTTAGKDRLDWSIADGTDLVIVELGANDALRGIDPKIAEAALDTILTRLKERKMAIVLAGMLAPPNNGPDYTRDFNGIYGRLAEKHGVPLYPFFLDGVAGQPRLNMPDGIHPTAEGVEEIVKRIAPTIEAAVKKLSAR